MNDLSVQAMVTESDLVDLSADIVCAYVSHNSSASPTCPS